MLARVVEQLGDEGLQWAQASLESDHGHEAQLFLDAGFFHATTLLYLVSVSGSFPSERPDDGLEFEPYQPAEHERLTALVERTYVGSLDCPAIEGLRPIKDVLAGYQAVGHFDAARWLFVRRGGRDVGCLLMAAHPEGKSWELSYMGVVPEARGSGRGLAMVRQAQWLAGAAGCERMVLAVDAENRPAIDVYAAAGFVAWDQRSLFLRVFRDG
jgi:ribosomal protein S18 acetylase RimI-like enzyme